MIFRFLNQYLFLCILDSIYIYAYSFNSGIETTPSRNISGENGFFWQLTDIHWDFNYSETGSVNDMCHQVNASTEDVGKFGNYRCDSPWTLVRSALQSMKLLKEHPDFILWTGDNAPHTNLSNFPVIYEALKNVTDELQVLFGYEVPIIPVLGNHDTYPKDDFPETNKAFYNLYLEKGNWKSIIPTDELENFRRGGYYKFTLKANIWILVLNTNLYYSSNILGQGKEDPGNQFEWMQNQFQRAKDGNIKIFVTAHAPPGYWERMARRPFLNETYNDKYVDILNEFGDVIIAQIYGHLHTDSFRIFGTNYDNLKSVAFISPSVTPFHPTRLLGGTGINPSIRLYTYNSSVVLDYFQYNLNLTKANNSTIGSINCIEGMEGCVHDDDASWALYYQATQLFGVNSLGVEELADVYGKLSANDTFFQIYHTMNSAGYDRSYCNATCKRIYLCVIAHLKINSVPKCITHDTSENILGSTHGDVQSIYSIFPKDKPDEAEKTFSLNSFMTATVTLVAAVTALMLVVGVMLIVSSVRRNRILKLGSKLPEFEWVSRHNGYKPLSIDAE